MLLSASNSARSFADPCGRALSSTPDETSMAYGRHVRTASTALSGIQAARQNDRPLAGDHRGDRPVDDPPGAAALDAIVRVEQDGGAGGTAAASSRAEASRTVTALITRIGNAR
jgi:hypothetical protein